MYRNPTPRTTQARPRTDREPWALALVTPAATTRGYTEALG